MKKQDSAELAKVGTLEQRAETAEQAGEYFQASQLWHDWFQKTGKPVHAHRHVSCLLRAERLEEATEYSRAYSERWPRRSVFVSLQLQSAYRQKAWEAMDALWAQLERITDDNRSALALIKQRLRDRHYPGALHAVEYAKRYWSDDAQICQQYHKLKYLYGADSSVDRIEEAPDMNASDMTPEMAMIAVQRYAADEEATNQSVIDLLQTLLERWPDCLPAIKLLLKYWLRENRHAEVVNFCQRRYEESRQYDAASILQWALALVTVGRVDEAVVRVREAQTQCRKPDVVQHLLISTIGLGLSTNSELRNGLEALCREHGIEGMAHAIEFEKQLLPPQRPLVNSFDTTQPIVASQIGSSRGLVIIFTGYAGFVGALPQELLERFFAGHGYATVRLVDRSGHLYLEGVPELGGSFEATVEALRQMTADYDTSRIITLGNSGGGMAALRYGAALNASHIIAFSPAVKLDITFMEAHGDYRAHATIHKLNRLYSSDDLDVRRYIESVDFTGRMDIYAGADSREDQCQIRHLEGIDRVYLHDVAGVSVHESIGPAVLDGTLLAALERVLP